MSRQVTRWLVPSLLVGLGVVASWADDTNSRGPSGARWRQHDVRRPKPPVVTPGDAAFPSRPSSDCVVLFDGGNLDAWRSSAGGPAKWTVVDGALQTVPGAGAIETKAAFGDVQLHIEWSSPSPPHGKSQDRGNSGIFLMGQFEIQVLDSFQAETYADGQAGAIYGQYPPLFNASRPPGEWQSYDIAFRRPRFESTGKLIEPARITVFHNGVLVQNNEVPFGPTSWLKWLPYEDRGRRGAISLQDHDHPVRFRNIWLRELPDRAEPTAADLARPKIVALSAEALDAFVGQYLVNAKPDAPKAAITREANQLVITFPFRPQALVIEPVSETDFVMPFTDARFTFHKDEGGRVTGVLFRVGDGEREMRRIDR